MAKTGCVAPTQLALPPFVWHQLAKLLPAERQAATIRACGLVVTSEHHKFADPTVNQPPHAEPDAIEPVGQLDQAAERTSELQQGRDPLATSLQETLPRTPPRLRRSQKREPKSLIPDD